MITNFSKNSLGTLDFDGKFAGMRKAQDFVAYPMLNGERDLMIQSDTRIGTISLDDGLVRVAGPYKGGAYFVHMAFAKAVDRLPADDLLLLKSNLMATASEKAGTNGLVFCDNSGASQNGIL